MFILVLCVFCTLTSCPELAVLIVEDIIFGEPDICFPAGTEVLTAVGPSSIEKIESGTEVYTYDLAKDEWELRKVRRRLSHPYKGNLIFVQTAAGAIQTTGNHPFYVLRGEWLSSRPQPADLPKAEQRMPGHGRWVNARNLQVGDLLRSKTDGAIAVTSLSSKHQFAEVYNLEIDGLRNYAIQQTGILVHNKQPARLSVYDFGGDVFEQTNKDYLDLHPHFHMEREVEKNTADYYMKLHARLAAGDTPDVAMFHSGPRQWEYADFQIPLDDYIKEWRDTIPEEVWAWHCKDGNPDNPVQLVPLTRQGVGVYYNKTNLRKAGLNPDRDYKEWIEFLDACEALKNAGITPITNGNPWTGNLILQLL
jgi:hypothetical protein